MIEGNDRSPELNAKLEAEPITLEHVDKLIAQIREHAVDSKHLEVHLQLTNALAHRIILEKPEKADLVKARLSELNDLIQKGNQDKKETTHKSGERDYKKAA